MAQQKQSPRDDFDAIWLNAITRRNALLLGGLALGGLTAGIALPACSADSTTDQPPDQAAEPTGGTLPAGLATGFTNLDPTAIALPGGIAVFGLIYEKLYRADPFWPRTNITPELAIEMPEQIAPTTYRIPLREEATFHDGTPLTADDVVFTIDRIKGPDGSPAASRFLQIIKTARAISPSEIEIDLESPTSLLAQRLLLIHGFVSKSAVEASPDTLELAPVGTGPYQVVTAVSNENVVLSRFEEYSGDRQFNYDDLEITFVPDANARISGLRSNRFKVIESVPESALQELASIEDLSAEAVATSGSTSLLFNCGKAPFDDVRVRQAVLYSIDREAITETSFFGQAEPAWANIVSPELSGSIEANTVYRYDPSHAKDLLAQAGYTDDPIKIDILLGDEEYIASQGPIIEENLRSVGFEPNMTPGAIGAHIAKVTEGNFGLWMLFTSVDIYGSADAEFVLRWLYTGSVVETQMYWQTNESTRVEELLNEAISASADTDRDQSLTDVQNLLQDQVPLAPLHFKRQISGWSNELEEFRPMPSPGLTLDGVRG